MAAKATSIVPAAGSTDTSSQPRRTTEGGGGTRPSIASQDGPSRVTYLFYQSIPILRDLLLRDRAVAGYWQLWYTDYYNESRQQAEVPPGFRDWSEIEDKAVQMRAWSPGIIHGLLQTEDYAAALLRTSPTRQQPSRSRSRTRNI